MSHYGEESLPHVTRFLAMSRQRQTPGGGHPSLQDAYRTRFNQGFNRAAPALYVHRYFAHHRSFEPLAFRREWRRDPFRGMFYPTAPRPSWDEAWIERAAPVLVPDAGDDAAEPAPAQRKKALEVLSRAQALRRWVWDPEAARWQLTLAAVMEEPVRWVYEALKLIWAEEFQAGKIGDYYESLLDEGVLLRAATDEALAEVARAETEWWRSEEGYAVLGALIGAPIRNIVLISMRDRLLARHPETDLVDSGRTPPEP